MTKKEKLQKALKKWVEAHIEGKNHIVEDSYSGGTLIGTKSTDIDIYSPICYKHRPDWLEADYRLIVGYEGDNIDYKILFLQNSEGVAYVGDIPLQGFDDVERIPIEDIPEEMLDEMLAVKDCGEVVQARMTKKSIEYTYNDYLAKKNEEIAKERECKAQPKKSKQDKWNGFNLVLSLIALGVSLIALIVKLC